MSVRISKFTPSQTAPELLESITVGEQRLRLLDDVAARIHQAQTSRSRNHTLVVGPRGAGKTHLITLIHSRTESSGITLSWLSEEAWMTLLGYGDFLRSVIEAADNAALVETTASSTVEREAAIADHAAAHGPIIVLVENFDQVLTVLEREGQQRLRQFMENTRSLLFVATTTALSRDFTGQDSPFYSFFTTERLEPLGVEDAQRMLERLAELSLSNDLAGLSEELIANRLQAVQHLAGGQPRMWSMFGQAVGARDLDELVPAFLELVDNFTPYYQQQLERLSAQQRRIVALLGRADHPMNVKEIAAAIELAERTTAAALSSLRDSGWVHHVESPFAEGLDKRLRYHELTEPLVRSMLQAKDARAETPIQAVVDFIKHWFDSGELAQADLGVASAETYRVAAFDQLRTDGATSTARQLTGLIESSGAPRVQLLGRIDDAIAAFQGGDADPVMTLPTTVRRALESRSSELNDVRLDVHGWARTEYGSVPHEDMDRWEERASEMVHATSTSPQALQQLLRWQHAAWDFESAEATVVRVVEVLGDRHPDTLRARANLAGSYWQAGHTDEAIDLLTRAINEAKDLPSPPFQLADWEQTLGSWQKR